MCRWGHTIPLTLLKPRLRRKKRCGPEGVEVWGWGCGGVEVWRCGGVGVGGGMFLAVTLSNAARESLLDAEAVAVSIMNITTATCTYLQVTCLWIQFQSKP